MRSKGLMASASALAAIFAITVAAPSWAAPPIPCDGPIGAVEIRGDISAGAECDLSGATVRGNVTVNPGGSLTTEAGSTTVITGNVQSSDATVVSLRGATSVGGDVRLTGTTELNLVEGNVKGNVEIEEGAPQTEVFGETVGGNVQVLNTTFSGLLNEVGIIESTVGGNVELGNNSLINSFANLVVVSRTTVAGNLSVYTNSSMRVRAENNSLSVDFNVVGGNAELLNNTGFGEEISVTDNTVTNNLICTGNEPQPTEPAGENHAKHKLGQCERL